jgi:hypothetical protein
MKTILVIIAIAGLAAASVPLHADAIAPSDKISDSPSGLANVPQVFGKGPQQQDKSLGFQNKNSTPDYGYWGVGPDYGNYRWPYVGPYGSRPRGRPMDALTYAPVPVEAAQGSAQVLDRSRINVSWPGGPQGVQSVKFDILGEADDVMVSIADFQYPFQATMPLPDPAQKVRITVCYTDGFSTNVFWVPW